MNILQYTRQEPIPSNGGIERVAQCLASAFRKDGHSVYFLHGDCSSNTVSDFIQQNNIDLILSHEANDLARTTVLSQALRKKKIPLVSVLHFDPNHCTKCFRASIQDLLHSGLSLREKFFFLCRNTVLYRYLYRRYFGRCYARIYEMSDAVVLLSEHYKDDYLRMTEISDASHLYCIPNLLTVDIPSSFSHENANHIILYVARLTYLEKRPDLMLRIWQQVVPQFPDWQLVIIGEGNYRPIMEQKVASQHIPNVIFMGKMDAASYYRSADILCMTSNNEGFPLVLTEAAAHGVVPFCFDCIGSATDIINDEETGFIVPSFDVEQYAERLTLLMQQPFIRIQMAASAKAHVSSLFSSYQIMPLWYNLFREVKNITAI